MRKFNKEMDYSATKEKALRLLEFRNHSKGELKKKLTIAGANSEDIDRVIEFLEEYSLINDRDYAKRLALDLQNLKKYGIRRIRLELASKGISPEYIEEAVEELPEPDIDEFIAMVEKRLKGDFERKNKDRVIRYFLNKGYSLDMIKNAISDIEVNYL
ncbi:MAG: regulatory protein RecX [Clostridia bacterium]|nr:regulatory protein RecX [Clostridia bacterium]